MFIYLGILKFFGELAHGRPNDIVTKYVFILNRIYANIESDNFTIVGVSVDTLGHIAETSEGKIALNSSGKINDCLKCFIEYGLFINIQNAINFDNFLRHKTSHNICYINFFLILSPCSSI